MRPLSGPAAQLGRASIAAPALLLAVLTACSGDSPTEADVCPDPNPDRLSHGLANGKLDRTPSPYDGTFAKAGDDFDVPAAVLKSVAWVETRWQMVEGAEEFPGVPAAFGVMALRGERLQRGAALAGVTVAAARREPEANIRAAAALLHSYATEAAIDRSRPDDWAAVVARYSGIEIEAGQAAYRRLVEGVLTRGAYGRALLRGELTLTPAGDDPCPEPEPPAPSDSGPPPPPPPPPPNPDRTDYAPAVWRPSPNFNQRQGEMHLVIIHTCEGNYTGCWSWLTNPVSQVSSHYVVDEEGTEISQLVRERDRAWHIAARYDCSLNRGHDCGINDIQSNHITVGIEHAGFASQSAFPASQIEASAALVCDVTRDREIPRDWQHIVGHGQLQPQNRTDPGSNWPWVEYLHLIQRICGEVVVDDESGLNDAAVAAVDAPPEWVATDLTPDYYGDGYRWASTREDAAESVGFSFLVETTETLAVDARWTSGPNRSPRAEFVIIDATGEQLASVLVDQTRGGGAWQPLGEWTFPAGWNRVELRHRYAPGFVVVADAVRVRWE